MSSSKPETVQVILRTRPTSNFSYESVSINTDTSVISLHLPKHGDDSVNNQQTKWDFKMSRILHNSSQDEVYDVAAADIVKSVLGGYNGTLMAYGQTGAGKTYTMSGGPNGNYKNRGIMPRALEDIYRKIESHPEVDTVVRLSYLEIYNETFYDLLSEGEEKEMQVRDEDGIVNVKGLSKVEAATEQDALSLLFTGQNNRQVAEHQLNRNSTRSHCIFTVYLESRSRIESSEKVVFSKLHLVDLAGSERVGKTGSSGKTLKEAQFINKSLTFLEQVVMALAKKNREHVPFRQSKLTNFLRDSLGGNSKTRVVANIWTEKAQIEETISTLKFAKRLMKLTNNAQVNVQLDPVVLVKKYQREIKELKQELAMHDTLANRKDVAYEPYTPEQQAGVRSLVNKYVQGKVAEIEIVNLRQIREVFKQMRGIICEQQLMIANGGGRSATSASGAASDVVEATTSGDHGNAMAGDFVGSIDQSAGGFHLGQSPADARPAGVDVMELTANDELEAPVPDEKPVVKPEFVPRPDETVAFNEYKTNDGSLYQQAYETNKHLLQTKKQEFKKISVQLNSMVKEIERLDQGLVLKRNQRNADRSGGDVEVIDEEEYALIRETKAKRSEYKALLRRRQDANELLIYNKGLVEQSKMDLCNNFLEWYNRVYPADPHEEESEVLDNGEQFDRLEREKVMREDPNSVSFFNARKSTNNKKKTKRRN